VQLTEQFGRGNVVRMAQRLGIESDLNPDPSIALGSNEVTLLELTGAYAHLAANGAIVRPYAITKIETTAGNTLYLHGAPGEGQALSESVVGMMNNMMSGVITSGTGRAAAIGRPAAGKTGTTSDYRDAWFMGYTPDLVAGVWVGNDDNAMMKKVSGGTLPAPIWRTFMTQALAGIPAHDLPTSSGFWQSVLPWQTPQAAPQQQPLPPDEYEPVDNSIHVEHPAAAPPQRDERPIQLSPDFWDTLFGSGEGHRKRR
jgi:penicillin-binding protein 1A